MYLFFFALKQRWKNLIRNWRIQNNGADIQKQNIPAFLTMLSNEENCTDTIKSGFKVCGLCPFDANAVDYRKCVEINVSGNSSSMPTEPNVQKSTQDLSHQEYVESKIDADLYNVSKMQESLVLVGKLMTNTRGFVRSVDQDCRR